MTVHAPVLSRHRPLATDSDDSSVVAPAGLKGLVVADTTIGDVRGEEGFFHYRQYPAPGLARSRPFEDVVQLLIDGVLPAPDFDHRCRPRHGLPAGVLDALGSIVRSGVGDQDGPADPQPLASLRSAVSVACGAAGFRPLLDLDASARRSDALRLIEWMPVLAAASHRLATGLHPVPPREDLSAAANLLWMLQGIEPDPMSVAAVDTYLVSTADHGFNASTFTARVVASTGSDIGSCVVAALGALSGPLHGGAPSRALDLLDRIGTPDRIDAVIVPMIAAGERIMGFGHAVYRTVDPRSELLREAAETLAGRSPQAATRVELAVAVERRVLELLDEHKPGRRLRTNVEFYAAVVMELCGIAPTMFTSTFACSRVAGWCAHAIEQAEDPRIIRPSARYVGPAVVAG